MSLRFYERCCADVYIHFPFFFAFQLFVRISVSTNTVHEKIASPVLVGSLLCVCVCVCVCVLL